MADDKKTPENVAPNLLPSEEALKEIPVDSPKALALPDQFLPPNLFIIPMGGQVVFPSLMAPLMIQTPRYVATIEEVIQRQKTIGLVLPRGTLETSQIQTIGELYGIGVAVKILKRIKMPDGSVNMLVQSIKRFKIKKPLSEQPHMIVEVDYLDDVLEKSMELDALTRSVVAQVKKLSETNPFFTDEMKLAMINAPGPGTMADLVAFSLSLPRESAQEFLETVSVKERFMKLLLHLRKEQDLSDLQKKIQEDVNSKIHTMQREFFLKEQMKVIRKELGFEEDGKSKSTRTFREKIEEFSKQDAISAEVKKTALDEVSRFETLSEQSPEFNVSRTYLEMLTTLPWGQRSKDLLDLKRARKILDEDHLGLKKVKERIVEFMAVRSLSKEKKGSILCLVGPPGVGKTSIGKSIARTLDRTFYRFSLGGMRDEAEIKGHRRTYVGAMPGKVIQAMKRAGTMNPVILLDEIDKLGASFQGDPASALLEVLDPEQNSSFLDHYLDVPFDLSEVIFIATANQLGTIPPALLDRMEVIELPGYTLEEKEAIAAKHIIPRSLKEHGIRASQIDLSSKTLKQIVHDYAREPGMRSLKQSVDRIYRKAAAQIVENPRKKVRVLPGELQAWLGPKRFYQDVSERIKNPGVVTGLAWTAMGGEILFIEAQSFPGSGQIKLTGQMGEVMTESASIAWSFVKHKLSNDRGLSQDYFKDRDIHLHIPAGAVPKDGPSAGVTMATALYSLMTNQVIQSSEKVTWAMTGELSLVGKVLPVGGIKEKLLAAHRAGVTHIILPKINERDLSEVPAAVRKQLKIHFVSKVEEVFALVLPQLPQRQSQVIKKGQRVRLLKSSRFKKGETHASR